ncbi:MAG: hypothetical protein EOO47_22900, partial [Flavobacterium sp.]
EGQEEIVMAIVNAMQSYIPDSKTCPASFPVISNADKARQWKFALYVACRLAPMVAPGMARRSADLPLQQLMAENDAQKILNKSKYKPKQK